jgi:hypothetical protein
VAGDRNSAALARQLAQQRAAEQHAAQQRVHQAQLAHQAQQRLAQQRQAQQAQQRQAQQRQAQQAQQRQAQQRLQHRQAQQRQAQQRQAQQRQAQRMRLWQRTAAKRAARQVETELAIEERQERQRVYAATATDELLLAAIAAPLKVGRAALRRQYMQAPVDVGDLERPLEPPRRGQFLRLPWPPWSRAARERREAEAESAYQAALAAYEEAEFDRVRRLSTAKLDHQRSQAEAADQLWADYQAGERDAVATYATVVLGSRARPDRAVVPWQVRYEPDERHLGVDYELPATARNADAVAQFALRVLFDLFHALDPGLVELISFNGLAVGGPSLASVTVTRSRWAAVSVLDGDPQTVLRRLDGHRDEQ